MKKVFFFILINKCSFKNAAKIVIIVHMNFYSRPKILYLAKQLFIFSDYEKVHCRDDWNDGARPYGMW